MDDLCVPTIYPAWRVTGIKTVEIEFTAPTIHDAQNWAIAWAREQKLKLHSIERLPVEES